MVAAELVELPPVRFDARRPWPLGLPSLDDAQAVITGAREAEPSLAASHVRALMILPEYLLDEARGSSGVARACASVWRAVVAEETLPGALAHHTEGLVALIEELTQAREQLAGLAAFAPAGDGDALVAGLDELIDRLVEAARFHAAARPKTVLQVVTRMLFMETVERGDRFRHWLPRLTMASVVAALLFHLVTGQGPASSVADDWVIAGNPESSRVQLVPGGPNASDRQLIQRLQELEQRGFRVTGGSAAGWNLERRARWCDVVLTWCTR